MTVDSRGSELAALLRAHPMFAPIRDDTASPTQRQLDEHDSVQRRQRANGLAEWLLAHGVSLPDAGDAPPNDGTVWDCTECGTNVTGPSSPPRCPHCGKPAMSRRGASFVTDDEARMVREIVRRQDALNDPYAWHKAIEELLRVRASAPTPRPASDDQLLEAFVAGCNAENELNDAELSPANVRKGVAAAMRAALGSAPRETPEEPRK